MYGINSTNVGGLESPWKQGHMLNKMTVNLVAISETRISDSRDFRSIFSDYEVYSFPSHPEARSKVAVVAQKKLDLAIWTIFLDPERKSVVLDMKDR